MATTHDTLSDSEIDTLNSLLRGQLAATESYDKVMSRLEDEHVLTDLQSIREEHVQAETLLREKVMQAGGEAIAHSDPWVACASAITSDSQALGPATALAALKQGEEQTINEFEDSLKHENIGAECKQLIRSNLLPTSRKHVAELNRLMGGMGGMG